MGFAVAKGLDQIAAAALPARIAQLNRIRAYVVIFGVEVLPG